MGWVDDVKNAMLDLIDEDGPKAATHVSLHTADPGTSGASEVTGGSYARQAITWNPASDGQKTVVEPPVFQVPGSTVITHFGLWNAGSGGTYRFGKLLPNPQTFSSPGTYTADSVTATV
jgi:hypothetical protein